MKKKKVSYVISKTQTFPDLVVIITPWFSFKDTKIKRTITKEQVSELLDTVDNLLELLPKIE
jgi:hypothetical protein